MQRHQLLVAAFRPAHGLPDPDVAPVLRAGGPLRAPEGRHIVGIVFLQEVHVLLGHQAGIHPVLHEIMDVLPHLLLIGRELRVLP